MSTGSERAMAGDDLRTRFDSIQSLGIKVGAVGLIACLIGAFVQTEALLQGYLVGFLFWTGLSLGGIGLALLHHLAGGSWGLPLRRPFEAAGSLIVLMAVFFVPVLLGIKFLYIWTDPEVLAHHADIAHKTPFLNVSFFTGRAVFYFVFWIAAAYMVAAWSRDQDRRSDDGPSRRLHAVAGPLTVLMFLTASFAAFDWGMSLDPDWYSTIYGAMFVVGEILSSLALATIVAIRLAAYEPMKRFATADRLNDIGNLLLSFTMLWAYMSFSQFLIIWLGNISEEAVWYLRRTEGLWGAVALFLIAFQFFAPFFALLSRQNKRRAEWVLPVAVWIISMRVIELAWLVLPARAVIGEPRFPWWSLPWVVASIAGIGGIWVAAFVWRLRSAPLIPLNDARVVAALEHTGEVIA